MISKCMAFLGADAKARRQGSTVGADLRAACLEVGPYPKPTVLLKTF